MLLLLAFWATIFHFQRSGTRKHQRETGPLRSLRSRTQLGQNDCNPSWKVPLPDTAADNRSIACCDSGLARFQQVGGTDTLRQPILPLAANYPRPSRLLPCMDSSSIAGAGAASAAQGHGQNGGPASSLSPTSPVSVRSQVFAHSSGVGTNGGAKRKRSSGAGVMMGDSPGSVDGDDDGTGDHHEKKRQPGVKRACNECRQQKVSQCAVFPFYPSAKSSCPSRCPPCLPAVN